MIGSVIESLMKSGERKYPLMGNYIVYLKGYRLYSKMQKVYPSRNANLISKYGKEQIRPKEVSFNCTLMQYMCFLEICQGLFKRKQY